MTLKQLQDRMTNRNNPIWSLTSPVGHQDSSTSNMRVVLLFQEQAQGLVSIGDPKRLFLAFPQFLCPVWS